MQQKLDRTYGKGLYKAGFVLLLFCCLFFTSCASDSRSTSSTRVGTQETTSTTSTTSSEARIKITDPNQKNTPNNLYGSDPAVLDAYFAREDTTSGAYKRIKSAAIGDTVFIVVDTANLSSRTIKVTIKDENKIIKNKIPFLQYKTKDDNTTFEEKPVDVSGEFSSKVRNDAKDKRFALYKIVLKAKEDDTTKKWQEEISKHTDKKLKLYLTVTVEGEEAIYCGSNFKDENQRATDKESNVWLNMDKKWFDVSLAMKTYYIYWNTKTEGKIEKYVPKNIIKDAENKYKYIYYDKEGNEHEICTVDKTIAQKWIKGSKNDGGNGWEERTTGNKTRYYQKDEGKTIELIKMPLPLKYIKGDIIIKLADNTDREYINPKAFASIIGALGECNYSDVTMNGFTSRDGTGAPSVSHVNGIAGDLRYLRKDQTGESLYINENPNQLDIQRQEKFIDALIKFGYESFLSYNIIINGNSFILKNCSHLDNHEHHLHLNKQGYNPNYKEINQ